MLFIVAIVTSLCLSTSCLADDIADIKAMLTALNAKVDTMESTLSLFAQRDLESIVGGSDHIQKCITILSDTRSERDDKVTSGSLTLSKRSEILIKFCHIVSTTFSESKFDVLSV